MKQIPVDPLFPARQLIINIVDDFVNPAIVYPPLYFQVNPNNIQTVYTKKINRSQTFAGFVEEYWGEDLDTINCTNSTGAFYDPKLGLSTITRTQTTRYFNFQNILDAYRNNGNTYDNFGRVTKRGNIVIYFHPGIYIGYFDTFDFTESSTNPYRLLFNFSFKVEKSYTGV